MPRRTKQTLIIILGILIAFLVFFAIQHESPSLGMSVSGITHPVGFFGE